MRNLLFPALVALALLVSSGCNSKVQYDPSITGTSLLVIDQFVHASPVAVHQGPGALAPNKDYRPKALFIPFRVDQVVAENRTLSRSLSNAFFNEWVTAEVLGPSHLELNAYNHGPIESARLGRQMGADFVVTGSIPYLYVGGSVGDTTISLRLEIIDTHTARTVWSMEQTAQMQADFMEDYIILTRKMRMPTSPVHSILARLARDMGEPVLAWTGRTPWEQVAQQYIKYTPHPTPPDVAAKQALQAAQKAAARERAIRSALDNYEERAPVIITPTHKPTVLVRPEPLPKQMAEPVREEGMTEPTAETMPAPVVEPAAEPVPEPMAEPETEPVTPMPQEADTAPQPEAAQPVATVPKQQPAS